MGIWIFVGSFFLILSLIIFINYKINHDFKIETSWLALSLSPVVVWLLTTEQLAEFSGFGLAFKLKEATSTPVSLEMYILYSGVMTLVSQTYSEGPE